MKMKPIVAACALAIAASAPAFAYDPTTTTADFVVRIGGATAQDVAFETIARSLMLSTNFDMIFNDKTVDGGAYDPANDGNDFRAAFGDADDTKLGNTGAYIGKKLLIVKRSKGGSWYGVGPVANGDKVYWMNPQLGGTPCTLNGGTTWICNTAIANLITAVPDLGMSDVEPDLFKIAANRPTGSSISFNVAPESAMKAYTGGATPTPVYALGFGVQANKNAPIDFAKGLSHAEYAGIMTGAVTDYNQLAAFTGSGSVPIVLCRRNNGSGTQAAAQAYFLNQGCGANSNTAAVRTTTTAPTGSGNAYAIVGNESGSNATGCINGTDQGIGVVSLEGQPDATGADAIFPVTNRKWVAINGVAPVTGDNVSTFNTDSMKSGHYPFFVESTFNVADGSKGGAVPAGIAAAVATGWIAQATLPSNMALIIPGSTTGQTLRNTGQLALSTNTAGANVMNASHGGKTCIPATQVR
jgi:hypothetical protein